MQLKQQALEIETRRQFFARGARGLGAAALGSMLGETLSAAEGLPGLPHFAPTAKRAVYIHLVGAPPQMETFDYKPGMKDWEDKELPDSIRQGQRLTTMSSGQDRFPIAPSRFDFAQYGQSGRWVSELLPHTANIVDDIAVIRSMYTEAINHEPAITFFQSGSQVAGKPSTGSWISYGLGSLNNNLPTFVVINATHSHPKANVQAISARLWSAGFLSAEHSGVALRAGADPVLFINNPDGVPTSVRRRMLDALAELNQIQHERIADPETLARIEQYEMAFRMQASVPELTDLSSEPESAYALYGDDARTPATMAHSCLTARRLIERDVRFVQIYQRGWDVHSDLPDVLPSQCKDSDQAVSALVQDLKQRGLLEDTLVVCAGEFGRTIYCQGKMTAQTYGRDHHPRCFSLWMAGGGVKGGVVHGETDEFSYNVVRDPVHVRDLQATVLHLFGIDHERLTFPYQGLNQKLTGVEPAQVVREILL